MFRIISCERTEGAPKKCLPSSWRLKNGNLFESSFTGGEHSYQLLFRNRLCVYNFLRRGLNPQSAVHVVVSPPAFRILNWGLVHLFDQRIVDFAFAKRA
jgi:hypothetical protein